MASFRFLHASDIHLDSPLRGLSGHEGSAAERIRTAARESFINLVSQAIEVDAAFVVIAGDLYDGDWRDFQTGLFFSRQMGRLAKSGIEVFVLYGNHDAESQLTKRLVLPENVKVFSSRRPETFVLEELRVALHGQSFRQRDVTENLVPAYPDPLEGLFNIGLLHTALGGSAGHENYAPCTLDDLITKGYDYWALGHVHNAQVLSTHPHIVFPGNLQGRHIRETGPKGACLVTVEGRQIADFTWLYSDVVRWVRLAVAIDQCRRPTDVVDCVRRSIEVAVAEQGDGRLLACRIELKGRTKLHSELLASREHLLAESQSAALGLGNDMAWVEKVIVATEPERDPESVARRQDALGELQRMLAEACEDEELLRQLATEIGEMARKLPVELRARAEDPVLKSAVAGDYAGLIALVADYLNGRLAIGGD